MFHRLLSIVVFILFVLDAMILLGYGGYGYFVDTVQTHAMIYAIAIMIQIPILYGIIYSAYIGPIQWLNQDIARFQLGIQDASTIKPTSLSQGMNSVIRFFIKSLDVLRVFKTELHEGRQLRSEVEIASEIQKQTLSQDEEWVPGLTIVLSTKPATEVGGDSLDIIKGRDDNYYIYVGDVTGHGVPSGFVMMMVNALISAFASSENNSATILANTNKILKPRIKQNMMMTCVMLRWDAANKNIYFTGAGHEFILVYRAKEKKTYKVKTGGVALGMIRDSSKILKEQEIPFDIHDIIVLYTDGVSEARYRSEQTGMLFGVDRIVESMNKVQEKTPEAIFSQITLDLSAFMGYKHKQYDDITLVVIQNNPPEVLAQTIDNPSAKIDPTLITEWNWNQPKNNP